MENKNIIIILVAVIVILMAVLGVMFLHSSKEPTKIEIAQTNLTVDDNIFSVKLADSKGNLLSENATLTIKDANGKTMVDEDVLINYDNSTFDFDLEKGNYVVDIVFKGNDAYRQSNASYEMKVEKVTPTNAAGEVSAIEYPEHSSAIGDYRVVEQQQELAVIEASNGESYVLAGDGYYTYGGHDAKGNIKLGSFVGKY